MALTRRRGTKRLDARSPGGQFQRSTLATFGLQATVCPYCRGINVLERAQALPGQAFAAPGYADPPAACRHCNRQVRLEDWDRDLATEPAAAAAAVPVGWSTLAELAELYGATEDRILEQLRVIGIADSESHSKVLGPDARAYSPAAVVLLDREYPRRLA